VPPPISLPDQIAKLARDTATLRSEVSGLCNKLSRFTKGRDLRPKGHVLGYVDTARGQRERTEEPRSAIYELLLDTPELDSAAVARCLNAIASDLDGAFRDIRATRADIEAIKNDSDLRADFKEWAGYQDR
jgi:hypothetical protein